MINTNISLEGRTIMRPGNLIERNLNSDDQEFFQYQQNEQPPVTSNT